jgi:hypothetical protein
MAKQKIFVKANSFTRSGFSARHLFVKNINVSGAEFRVQYSVNGEQFEDELDKGASVAGLPDSISNWVFYNDTATDLIIDLKIGDTYYQKNELVGNIESVNTYKNKTLEGNCFHGEQQFSAVAFGKIQLWNPADSGVNAVLDRFMFASFTSTYYAFSADTAALGALNAGTIFKNKLGLVDTVANKLEIRTEDNAVSPASNIYTNGGLEAISGYEGAVLKGLPYQFDLSIKKEEPIILTPGTGISIGNSVTGAMAAAALLAEWNEEAAI